MKYYLVYLLLCFAVVHVFFSIDATHSHRLGRYVNDSPRKYSNCSARAMYIQDIPRVVLFSTKKIPARTELRYDYGGTVPWRKVSLFYYNLHSSERV